MIRFKPFKMTSNWALLQDLEDAFGHIMHFEFLIDQLQEAVNNDDRMGIISIAASLTAFIPVYTENFDKKMQVAWRKIVIE